MKHTFKTLLGLVLVVFVLAGCQNPAGPETPEVNEPPVVETPEENVKLTKVEFRWGTKPEIGRTVGIMDFYSPMYLLDLYIESDEYVYGYPDEYVYGYPEFDKYPEGYGEISYIELAKTELFEKFSDDVFEKVFGTKYYKEGTTIDLKPWTFRAVDLVMNRFRSRLQFSMEDTSDSEFFEEIKVGSEDIVVYVFWDTELSEVSFSY